MGQAGEINGEPIHTVAVLKSDHGDPPSLITFEEIRLLVIQRGDRFGVYIWDNLCAQRNEYPPRAWFPPDEKYRVIGKYAPYLLPIKVDLSNSFGELENDFMLGYVTFKLGDKRCQLDATELNDGCLFLQFKDVTNGGKTYPSGRYLITEPVKEDGQVLIDFNKSYNPPSAFTNYAICTFASKSNHVNLVVEAGELYERSH